MHVEENHGDHHQSGASIPNLRGEIHQSFRLLQDPTHISSIFHKHSTHAGSVLSDDLGVFEDIEQGEEEALAPIHLIMRAYIVEKFKKMEAEGKKTLSKGKKKP